jgi:hypothetical protein
MLSGNIIVCLEKKIPPHLFLAPLRPKFRHLDPKGYKQKGRDQKFLATVLFWSFLHALSRQLSLNLSTLFELVYAR